MKHEYLSYYSAYAKERFLRLIFDLNSKTTSARLITLTRPVTSSAFRQVFCFFKSCFSCF